MFFLEMSYLAYDALMQGIVKLLIIVAILQLVKKIPDLINTIFGTQIKDRGGIKGRLGEMAGVGGIAQKAWSSLGTGAKNLAKLGLAAPAAGAVLGANAAYKRKHGGKSFWDTDKFRKAKGAFYGLRAGLKSGNAFDILPEYEKMSAPPQHSRNELMKIRANAINGLTGAGVSSQGTWTNEIKDSKGNIVHDRDGNQMFKKRSQTLSEIGKVQDNYRQMFSDSKEGKNLITAMDRGVEASMRHSDLVGVQASGEKAAAFASDVCKMIRDSSAYSAYEKTRASEIATRLEKNERVITADDAAFLQKYMDKETAESFATAVKKYDDALETALAANPEYKVKDLTKVGNLSGLINSAKAAEDDSLAEQQGIVDNMSDADKAAYQVYSGVLKQQTSSLSVTNQFNTDAPEDKVVNETGGQIHGWANDAKTWAQNTVTGSEIKSQADSASSSSTSSGEADSETTSSPRTSGTSGLFESSGANNPKNNSSSRSVSENYWRKNITGSSDNKNKKSDDK